MLYLNKEASIGKVRKPSAVVNYPLSGEPVPPKAGGELMTLTLKRAGVGLLKEIYNGCERRK